MAKDSNNAGAFIMAMFIVTGTLAGSLIAESLGSFFPLIAAKLNIGLNPPAVIDLYFFSLTIGFCFNFNLGTAIGAIGGFFLGRKFS